MKAPSLQFDNIIKIIYNLPLDVRLELKQLLEHNIADTRRDEILNNYKEAKREQKSGLLKFSSNIKDLKKML
jgi:hypothetical protein